MRQFSHALRSRLSEPENLMVMADIEQSAGAWLVLADSYRQMLVEVEEGTSHALLVLQAAHISVRIANLTEAFIDLVNNDHVLAAPPVARAVYETGCIPCYMVLEVLPRINKESNDALRLIYRLGLGGNNEAGFKIRPITVRALHKAMRRYLAVHFTGIGNLPDTFADETGRYLYGELSDRTHPNFGGFIHSLAPGDEGKRLQLRIRPVFTDENIVGLLTSVAIVLVVAASALKETLEVSARHPIPLAGGPDWRDGDRY